MAKTRMTQARRNILQDFAAGMLTKLIRKELDLDRIEEGTHKLAIASLKADYPQKDMRVLQKYGHAEPALDLSVRVCLDHSREDITDLLINEESLLVPEDLPYNFYVNVSGELPVKYVEAKKRFESQLKERMKDYKALINAARFVEDVLEAFPAAEVLRERLTGQSKALVELNDEIKIRIWEDQAEMVELAAADEKVA